jgi:hypothetical protein
MGSFRSAEGDDDDAWKRRSNATRLQGSYYYMKYSLNPPPGFNKWEARANRSGGSLASASASTSRSRYHAGSSAFAYTTTSLSLAPPRVRMEVDAATLAQVTTGKTIIPEDFIDDSAFPYIVALLEQNSCLAAQKSEEW